MVHCSRRRFLALVGSGLGGAALASACGGAAPTAAPPTAVPEVAKPFATAAAAPAPQAAAPAAQAGVGPNTPLLTARPPTGKAPVTLRFHMRSGGDKSEPAIYVERPGEWMKETGHKVELEPIPAGKDYAPKVVSLAAGGTIGDLLFTGYSDATHIFYVKNKILNPDDDFMAKNNIRKNEWVKAIVESLTFEGKMYGMPKAANPAEAYIAVNLKAFDEAGLKKPEVYGNSFDTIRDWAIKLSKGPADRRDVYGYYTHTRANQAVTNGVRQRGADLVDKAGEKSLVDSPAFDAWLQWNHKLILEDKVHPQGDVLPAGDANAMAAMFAAGKLAMAQVHRAWMVAYRTAVGDKFPWMTIQYPRGQGALGWVANIDTHATTSASKNKDEAFTLTYALADRRFAYLVAKGQGYLSGRVDNLEAIGELGTDPFLQLQQKCTEEEDPWWIAKNLRQLEVEAELVNQLDLVWLGKRPPDKAFVGDLKKGLDDILAKPPI
jgi:ABC-type glycerol-3-phosphate transport system substrate-binding protein